MDKLTNRQKDVLDYIKSYVAKHGYPPAVREIGSGLGLNSPATIQSHITALETKGYIKKTNSKYRSLEIVGNNEYLNEEKRLTSEFEKKYGPLNLSDDGLNVTPWAWIEEPWPWKGGSM